MARVTQQYWDDRPRWTKGLVRWLRRRVHLAAAAQVDGQKWSRKDQIALIERAVAVALDAERREALVGWVDEDAYRGRGYSCGRWALRATFLQAVQEAVRIAGDQIDAEYASLDRWLLDFEKGLMFSCGPVEPHAATVFPGGRPAWEEARLKRRFRCRRRGCVNVIDYTQRGAHIRKYCATCRPSRSKKPEPEAVAEGRCEEETHG